MLMILALICPPLALAACKKWGQAIPCGLLFLLAVATAGRGVGMLIDVALIMWACNVVSDEAAGRRARAFVKSVRPTPIVRR